jgi:hypothetical protein
MMLYQDTAGYAFVAPACRRRVLCQIGPDVVSGPLFLLPTANRQPPTKAKLRAAAVDYRQRRKVGALIDVLVWAKS